MILVERQAPSHWYLRDGTPFHEIARSDGKGNRPVRLSDARKVLALPSVTKVLNILAKPGLDAWKIEQGIMAALTLPRPAEEPLDSFAHRVVEDMTEQVSKAADFGSAIHAACEVYATAKELPTDAGLLPYIEGWREWFDANVERVQGLETVYVNHEHGYARRVDMVALLKDIGWAVVDFKTQKIKRGAKGDAKPGFYETWPLQLAAYQQAILRSGRKNIKALVSVVIDSAQPGPVHVNVWANGFEQNTPDYFKAFWAALQLWKYVKSYDPSHASPAFCADTSSLSVAEPMEDTATVRSSSERKIPGESREDSLGLCRKKDRVEGQAEERLSESAVSLE